VSEELRGQWSRRAQAGDVSTGRRSRDESFPVACGRSYYVESAQRGRHAATMPGSAHIRVLVVREPQQRRASSSWGVERRERRERSGRRSGVTVRQPPRGSLADSLMRHVLSRCGRRAVPCRPPFPANVQCSWPERQLRAHRRRCAGQLDPIHKPRCATSWRRAVATPTRSAKRSGRWRR